MANREHLKQLQQGVESWNKWRAENQQIQPDLSKANLSDADLSKADLSDTCLRRAELSGTNLSGANLSRADLKKADLRKTCMVGTNLSYTNLSKADLSNAHMSNCDMNETNVSELSLHRTTMAKINLSTARGLATIRHAGPSHIELFSVQLPKDDSSIHFLRSVGVPEEWIEHYRTHPASSVQCHTCSISYDNADEIVVHRLYTDLLTQGIRCWFLPKSQTTQENFREQIREAIYLQDKLLLVLSRHTLENSWIETAVEMALDKEKQLKQTIIFPIRLDESVLTAPQAWIKHLCIRHHIGDFTRWNDPQAYQAAFERLIHDLRQR